jgi:AcrR family transcriptional regulator
VALEPTEKIIRALSRKTLTRDTLTARRVAELLGQTTGYIYHHWGSFDGFLLAASARGWERLVVAITKAYDDTSDPFEIPVGFMRFAIDYPEVYWLLAERPLNKDSVKAHLKEKGHLPAYTAWKAYMALLGRAAPHVSRTDARLLHATVHGLASQLQLGQIAPASPNRATEVESALALAREIGKRLFAKR